MQASRFWTALVLALPIIAPVYQWRFPLFGVPTNALEVLIIVAMAAYVVAWRPSRYGSLRSDAWRHIKICALLPLFLIAISATLSLTQTQDLLSALGTLKSYLVIPVFFGAITWRAWQDEAGRNLFMRYAPASFTLAALWLTSVAIAQVVGYTPIPGPWQAELRATGPFPYPNALGHALAPLVILAIGLLARARMGLRNTILLSLTILTGTLGIFLARTEAALIAIVATGVLALFLRLPKRSHRLWFTSVATLFAALAFLQPTIQEKLLLRDWSGQTRLATWSETWQALTASPTSFLLGFGPNQYPQAMVPFHTHTYLEIFQYPHQLFLNIWVEYGLLAVFGFLWAIVAVGKTRPWNAPYRFAATLALLGMCIHGLVDVPFFKNDLALLTAFLLAAALAPFPPRLEETR